MQHTGAKDTQLRESSNQKVHPQPMEEANQNPDAMEALVSRIFTNISSLKSAYIQLQAAHTPYDPDKIQAADKLVISELKNLSELKHFYREHNPKPVCVSPQDSRLAAEIQEQQSLLKTYEVMLEQQIQEANQKKVKLEKNLKLRGLSVKESEGSGSENGLFSLDLTPDLFKSAVEAAYRAIHDFSKPLINMMKAAGWDLDAAANSIEPNVIYAKRAHKKYAFESHICQRMFIGFQDENFSMKPENPLVTKESLFQQYLAMREIDPLDAVGQSPDSLFGKFCQSKYLLVKRDSEFSEVYMESVVKNFIIEDGDQKPKVGLMVMPGFWIGGSVIQAQVYLTGVKVETGDADEILRMSIEWDCGSGRLSDLCGSGE
ncbi:hypothetical protein DH2020_023270 [Rehmannia glutinosa]|uniref:DUF641 domain-containing protein n=1 Tax=Rehmannia glutinosa TaxID=99300 RepID=A0ABR0W5K2_REHGL